MTTFRWNSKTTRAWIYQALVLLVVVSLVTWLMSNTLANMKARGIQSGFGFLFETAGFDIGESLIPFDSNEAYWKAFLVGLLNTLRVSITGIFLCTIFGVLIGVGRVSGNALARGLCYVYTEFFRNIPLLLQLLMWYILLVEIMPNPQEALHFNEWFFLSKGGLAFPIPDWRGSGWIGLWDVPYFVEGEILGGATITPEFLAITMGLTLYTTAFVAEVVRGGIQSVSQGQVEAAQSLSLSPWQITRWVVLPQAMRVIIPPMTNQYLNLTKNSSLAVAIGYPDLVNISNTSLNQTGHAVECIAIVMMVYLSLSLITSVSMNAYNRRMAIKER